MSRFDAETLALMRAPAPTIELRVTPLAPQGRPISHFDGKRHTLSFHSEAEKVVWLDQMREQGMQG